MVTSQACHATEMVLFSGYWFWVSAGMLGSCLLCLVNLDKSHTFSIGKLARLLGCRVPWLQGRGPPITLRAEMPQSFSNLRSMDVIIKISRPAVSMFHCPKRPWNTTDRSQGNRSVNQLGLGLVLDHPLLHTHRLFRTSTRAPDMTGMVAVRSSCTKHCRYNIYQACCRC